MNAGVFESDKLGEQISINRYNANGQMLFQRVLNPDGSKKYDVDYSHTYDAAGNLLDYSVTQYGDDTFTNTFTHDYIRFDSYQIAGTRATSTLYQDGYNSRSYDINGNLIAITDATKAENNRAYINNASGQALVSNQNGNMQKQLIVNDQVLGRYGVAVDRFKAKDDEGNPQFAPITDFNFSFAGINSSHPATSPTTYQTKTGDTLQSIARAVYGDSSYWYLLADANNLNAQSPLIASRSIALPAATLTIHNNADSFKLFNAADLIGDVTPNLPPPEEDEGCGGLLQIFVIVVAVVATVFTAGLLAAPAGTLASGGLGAVFSAGGTALAGGGVATTSIAAGWGLGATATAISVGAVAGAVGSVASQGVAIATGLQDSFSWKAVGLGALSGGVSAGVGSYLAGTALGGQGFVAVTSRAMISNALTQGIGVATGLQDKFSWTNVAAAGVGAGVGQFVNGQLAANNLFQGQDFGSSLARGAISGLAAGTAVALLHGGKINITQIATDAFGNALGNSLVESMSTPPQATLQYSEDEQANDLARELNRGGSRNSTTNGLNNSFQF